MSVTTKIEWCDSTVNPTMGCDGCELWEPEKRIRRCYAGVLHENGRGKKPGHAPRFDIVTPFPGRMRAAAGLPDLRGQPRSAKPWLTGAPRLVFVSDMGDALSKDVPFVYLEHEVLRAVSSKAGRAHHWLWLTKRPERMAEFFAWAREIGWTWPENLWVGTSVTTRKSVHRVRHLVGIGDDRVKKFLSVEPQSEPIDPAGLHLESIHWVIQGGESGKQAQVFDIAWARSLRDACDAARVPYFLKQLGEHAVEGESELSTKRKGGDWSTWPDDLAIREVPGVDRRWSRPQR